MVISAGLIEKTKPWEINEHLLTGINKMLFKKQACNVSYLLGASKFVLGFSQHDPLFSTRLSEICNQKSFEIGDCLV